MDTSLFQCALCKKFRAAELLETAFKDGTFMCKYCGDDIRGSFSYYVEGKQISKEEYDRRTNEDN